MNKHLGISLFLVLVASGCSTLAERAGNNLGIDGEACVGSIQEPIAGLAETANAVLQSQAQLASGKGGTCTAKVFAVTAPVVLYRVFDSSKPYSKLGSWWSLSRPAGSREEYRADYGICPEWSNLDRLVACELRPGSEVVVGTTQSATCADGSVLPKTKETQVFVANDGKIGIYHVGACSEESVWP